MAPSTSWSKSSAFHAGVGGFESPRGHHLPQVHNTEAMFFIFFMLLGAGHHIKLPTPHIAGRTSG